MNAKLPSSALMYPLHRVVPNSVCYESEDMTDILGGFTHSRVLERAS